MHDAPRRVGNPGGATCRGGWSTPAWNDDGWPTMSWVGGCPPGRGSSIDAHVPPVVDRPRVPTGQTARLTNAKRNVEAQGRGASAFHIFDGGTPKKVTERPPPRGGSDARVPDPVTPR